MDFRASKLERALAILSLCVRTLVGIVFFLVTLEAFHIFDIHCLPRISCFRVFCRRRPNGSLYGLLASYLLDHFHFRALDPLVDFNNITIVGQFMSHFSHHIYQCLECPGTDLLAKYIWLETTGKITISFSARR